MSNEIRVPALGESITEATIAQWYKKPGEAVAMDEPLCELETDKVTIEVPAQMAGVLAEVVAGEGETVEVGALLGSIGEGEGAPGAAAGACHGPATASVAPPRSTMRPRVARTGAGNTSAASSTSRSAPPMAAGRRPIGQLVSQLPQVVQVNTRSATESASSATPSSSARAVSMKPRPEYPGAGEWCSSVAHTWCSPRSGQTASTQ